MEDPPSPCTGLCRIDPASALCLGCRRTLAEITAWPSLTREARHALLTALACRPAPKP